MSFEYHVLVLCTGSVASLKVPLLCQQLMAHEVLVRVVATDSAANFLECETEMPEDVKVFRDKDEWASWNKRGDPVLHIDLMKWADMMVVAPASANTLAKLANGLCDNLATCVARAWPLGKKPAIFAPAMNTNMWNHPVTKKQVETLISWGYSEIPPVAKQLMCGDKGEGAMAEVDTIIEKIITYKIERIMSDYFH
ncbi:phosphopantothenoylcysteine decarboxylase [Neocloeon triangulifer]|uniref:phosphopantothenoylcysteine decarboxylase n=1 Tax=Neocloeon triangulifer TaxID=2078957 RepID=UPI00286EEBBD|nr:phosphopantothenoylcysteine decarboxylase [Neocloeon triangulifer]